MSSLTLVRGRERLSVKCLLLWDRGFPRRTGSTGNGTGTRRARGSATEGPERKRGSSRVLPFHRSPPGHNGGRIGRSDFVGWLDGPSRVRPVRMGPFPRRTWEERGGSRPFPVGTPTVDVLPEGRVGRVVVGRTLGPLLVTVGPSQDAPPLSRPFRAHEASIGGSPGYPSTKCVRI